MAKAEMNDRQPLLLIVPGLNNSGPAHWQSIWEQQRDDCHRVDLGTWEQPQRDGWVERLDHTVETASRPVVLVAHSLGCHAVAWWSALNRNADGKVVGALLVAPPDVEDTPLDKRLAVFAPVIRARLPFPSIVVASQNDPYAAYGKARRMARIWGSRLIDAGPLGHINADSGIKDWPYGRFLLRRLIAEVAPAQKPLLAGGAAEFWASQSHGKIEAGR